MIIFGPKQTDVNQIKKNYDSFVQNFHFFAPDKAAEAVRLSKDKTFQEITESKYLIALVLGLEDDRRFLRRVFMDNNLKASLGSSALEIYLMCDGLGKLTEDDFLEHAKRFSTEHIDQSSAEAIQQAADVVRYLLIQDYNS